MQQLMPAVEIFLLVATFVLFLMTRKIAADIRNHPPQASADLPNTTQADAVKMARQVADLLAELQSAATAVTKDWEERQAELHHMLTQAKMAETNLQTILQQTQAQTQLQQVSPPPSEPVSQPEQPADPASASVAGGLTMAQSITEFGAYLHDQGRTESTANRAIGYVKEFALWWGGQRYETSAVSGFSPAEIETYFEYLQGKNYHPHTVKRKMTALRLFSDWCILPHKTATTASSAPAPKVSASPAPAPSSAADERRRNVLAWAQQGLTQREIAAKTGLEQEAVRMILRVNTEA